MTEVLKIGTHNGQFHCDEVLACFMLKQTPKYKNATIVRSRDENKLAECDIVVDVGAIYDLSKNRFDHHQKSFNETFSSIVPEKPWKIKLSSAGLVYVHFGKQVLAELLKKNSAYDEKLLEKLYDIMYENFIREIDAIDNGIEIAETKNYEITTNLSARVGRFNPVWNETNFDENERFHRAVEYAGDEFESRLKYYALTWWPARKYVYEAIENRFKVDESGAILKFDVVVPWKSHLFEIEQELGVNANEIKYVVYKDNLENAYRIQCVPESEHSFTSRLGLPQEWRGLRNDDLSRVSNIEGGVFVHMNGFIGGNKTLDGVLQMARKSLQISK